MSSQFFKRHQAASTTEMGLLIGLIAIAIIASVSSVGDEINTLFGRVDTDISAARISGTDADPATYTNCKQLQGTPADKGTGTYTLAGGQTVTCNMDLQGGGWTQLNSYSVNGRGSGARWNHSVDDLNIEYDQLLISGSGDNIHDYHYHNTNWNALGIHTARLVLTVNGVNYVRQGSALTGANWPACLTPSRYQELSASSYNLIDPIASSDCIVNINNSSNYCAESVLIDLPTGGRISQISDVESFENRCASDNEINLTYDLFVR